VPGKLAEKVAGIPGQREGGCAILSADARNGEARTQGIKDGKLYEEADCGSLRWDGGTGAGGMRRLMWRISTEVA